jgi:molecular chaperone HtpG
MPDTPLDSSQYEIKIDLQGLIRLLAKNLYAESDVFIRELVQNAHDSIKRRSILEQNAPPGLIRIRTNREVGTITITDNGSGLTEQEVHDYLATIGRSGTGEFRQELLQKGRQAEVTLIGQFGIGLLSAFVVAYKVEVETLSVQPENPPWHWISEGQSHYQLQRGARQDVGTTVTLHISDNYRDMLNSEELRKAIKKYADFIPYQIFLNDERAPANAVNAPWHLSFTSERERLEEYALFCLKRFPDYILEVIPVSLKTPYQVDGVLYISDRQAFDLDTTGMVDIYQARMFITNNNRDLLPSWAKFVRGVIDSPHFTPTASRDAIQLDATAREIKEALGEAVMQHLKLLAERNPTRFERIMEWHSYYVKGMATAYDDFFDAIADLVPFETNNGPMSLRRYCEDEKSPRLEKNGNYDLFYFSEPGSATQFYMLCNAKGLLVINASHTFEETFLKKYAERHANISLHQISADGSEFLFEKISAEDADTFRNLEIDFRRTIPDHQNQVRIVRFKPTTLPAVTVLTADAKLRRELKDTQVDVRTPESVRILVDRILQERPALPVTLHLNADNPTIQQMAQMAINPTKDPEVYRAAIQAIYHNATLLAQHVITPDAAQAIFGTSNNAIKLMIDQAKQLNDMQTRLSTTELKLREKEKAEVGNENQSKHIICMVALPFKDNETFAYKTVLLPALRTVLEQAPYYWQVVRADEGYFEETIERNVAAWMKLARAYIADISDLNPNVMMELGYMRWARKQGQPVVVLERNDAKNGHLADLAGLILVRYPAANGNYAVNELAQALKAEFDKDTGGIQNLNRQKDAHYLSPLLLREKFRVDDQTATILSKAYITMESFVLADGDDIRRKAPGLSRGVANGLKEDVVDLLKELKAHNA